MSIAALVRSMAAAGAPPEAIALAVEAIEARDAQIEQNRSTARDRKRRQRERERDGHVTVTGQSQDNCDIVPETPSLDKSPQTPKIKPTPHAGGTPTHEAPASAGPSIELVISAWLGLLVTIRTVEAKRWRGMAPPIGVTGPQWRGFLDHRKALRHTLTPRAYELLCGKLAKRTDPEWPPGRIIDLIIERGWRSFEWDWLDKEADRRNGQRHHHNERPDDGPRNPMVRAGIAREARFAGQPDELI